MAQPKPRSIIIDTDPGIDDALAILYLLSCPEVSVKAITIAPGNHRDPAVLGANANLLLRLAGMEGQVPVGLSAVDEASHEPDEAQLKTVAMVHGEDGMGGVASKYGRSEADRANFHALAASDLIHKVCADEPGKVSLVCIAPLTNLAAALRKHPDLTSLVDEVVIMGGALTEPRGNRLPAAEANFCDDPAAAQLVLTAGFAKVALADLGMTHQTNIAHLQQACARLNSVVARFITEVSVCYIDCHLERFKKTYAPAHDIVAAIYFVHPDMFATQMVRVEVETQGLLTSGMSIADWRGQWGRPANCAVMTSMHEPEAFAKVFLEGIAKLPRA